MNVNGTGAAGYPAAGTVKVCRAQDGTQSFNREFMGMASRTPPSFVGKVWAKEETLGQSRNLSKINRQASSNVLLTETASFAGFSRLSCLI